MKKINDAVDKSISRGWKMSKRLSSGGFLSNPTYDIRTVYDRERLYQLNDEGFVLEDDAGLLAMNILLSLREDKPI